MSTYGLSEQGLRLARAVAIERLRESVNLVCRRAREVETEADEYSHYNMVELAHLTLKAAGQMLSAASRIDELGEFGLKVAAGESAGAEVPAGGLEGEVTPGAGTSEGQ